ncbi:IPP transferase-domain-containing protein [Kalaharituber pfeilii]|nr:IPP transferase-domain-containing protein [Kalaharituber pfeilii]
MTTPILRAAAVAPDISRYLVEHISARFSTGGTFRALEYWCKAGRALYLSSGIFLRSDPVWNGNGVLQRAWFTLGSLSVTGFCALSRLGHWFSLAPRAVAAEAFVYTYKLLFRNCDDSSNIELVLKRVGEDRGGGEGGVKGWKRRSWWVKSGSRYATAAPLRPLITVIGATGTGKSQLAVDLSRTLNGEIINADAMQMYEGLEVMTNKMPIAERMGIRHHYLGIVPRGGEMRVGVWEGGVRGVIEQIRERDNVPVVVGGTHYYVQALLYPSTLGEGEGGEEAGGLTSEELAVKYPILVGGRNRNASTTEIREKLKAVDPVMAARWHPNDRRKIKRSLEIYYLHNCKPASEIYRTQQERQRQLQQSRESEEGFRNLIFWVHAEAEVLERRLRERVDAMVEQGLFGEVKELWTDLRERRDKGEEVDMERGVWQSIGFKEFLPWLEAGGGEGGEEDERLEGLKREGLERMKISTVQYARTQQKWIRGKLMNAMKEAEEANAEDYGEGKRQPSNILYLLDSTNVTAFTQTVSEPAIAIARTFLSSAGPLPDPRSLSALAEECLRPKRDWDFSKRMDLWVQRTCELCDVTTVDEESWTTHMRSRKHKNRVAGRRKREEAEVWKEKKRREREREEAEKVGEGGERVEGGDGKDEERS